jgi:hypothetical protein
MPETAFPSSIVCGISKGNKKYKSSKANLAERWQFESVPRLLELINDPDKMEIEVYGLNATMAGSPSLNEYS